MADAKSPTPGEITIMAAAGVALIFSFFSFYSAPGGFSDVTVWSSGLFPVATLMVIFVIVMGLQIALTKFLNLAFPDLPFGFTWEQVHLVLGLFAALYAVAYLLVNKGGYSFGIGFWFILIACVAALVGAVLLMRERAATPPA